MAKKEEVHKYVNIYAIGKDRFMNPIDIPAETEEWFVNDRGFICIEVDGVVRECGLERSENGLTKFAYNNDGQWKQRVQLISECINLMMLLGIRKDEYFAWFLKDKIAMKLKKDPKNLNEWSWDRLKVHTTSIYNLRHIRNMLIDMHKNYHDKFTEEYEHMMAETRMPKINKDRA